MSSSRISTSSAWFAHLRWPLLIAVAPLAHSASEPWTEIKTVFAEHCYDCHGGKKTKGGVDLKKLDADPQVMKEFELWSKVRESIFTGDMPPDDRPEFPETAKKKSLGWVTAALDNAVNQNAGDPGPVTMRRLTNSEYDRTIRDLTNIRLNFSSEFAPDGGGGEGFSNVGDVLFVNPQQLDKYFNAARSVADHASILPGTGITFQEQRIGLRGPVQIRAQGEQALYVWYQKMAAPFLPKDGEDLREADYMLACWKFKHKAVTGAQSLEALATESKLMPAFLENWWQMLNNEQSKSRYLDLTRVTWRELPAPDASKPGEIPAAVTEGVRSIQAQQRSWLGPATKPGEGTQRHQQDADGLREYNFGVDVKGALTVHLLVGDAGDGNRGDWLQISNLEFQTAKESKTHHSYLDWMRQRLEADKQSLEALAAGTAPEPKPDAAMLQARIKESEQVLARFGKHPLGLETKADMMVVQAPIDIALPLPPTVVRFTARGQLDQRVEDADFATAQWTATVGEVPDLNKIIPGLLTVWKRQTETASKTMQDFDKLRQAFPDEYVRRLEEVARNFYRGGKGPGVYYLNDTQLLAVIPPAEKLHWEKMMADWRLVQNREPNKQQGKEWDEALKKHLTEFASQAWRRDLVAEEQAQIVAMYDSARSRELDRESAGREVLLRVLVSPKFLFKLEDASEPGERRLTAWELATRLSYLAWASAPDAELRAKAADGSLLQTEVLKEQTQRLLRDPRASAMAEEFTGQWLRFNGFVSKSNVDAKKFPEFTPELRADMYEETLDFFTYLIRENRPIREIYAADYTFINERLATFYGVPEVTGPEFRKVSVAAQHRGGILGMAALLTKNSYPHRTSPVLRGNWLLAAVMGLPTPPPPNNVPKLDDSVSKATSLRTRLEAHRKDRACAACHDRIDPLGFALEGFDPIGRVRTIDDTNQPVDDSAQWKNDPPFRGVDGLRTFLSSRDKDLVNQFCRKLLGYSLGRSLLPTDKPLIEKMKADLAKNEGRFSAAVLAVVQSRQFQNRRND